MNNILWFNQILAKNSMECEHLNLLPQTLIATKNIAKIEAGDLTSIYSSMLGTFIGYDKDKINEQEPKLLLVGLDKEPFEIIKKILLSPLSKFNDIDTLKELKRASHRVGLEEAIYLRFGENFCLAPIAELIMENEKTNIYLLISNNQFTLVSDKGQELTEEDLIKLNQNSNNQDNQTIEQLIKLSSNNQTRHFIKNLP